MKVEPMAGFEPATSSLPRKCSTPELHRQMSCLSGRRGSNSRPLAWKANALPTELLPRGSGWRWIRTTEGISQQIYSLPHLATLVSTRGFWRASCRIRTNDPEITNHVLWPTELKRLLKWAKQCFSEFRVQRYNLFLMFASNRSKKFHIFCFIFPQRGIKEYLFRQNGVGEEVGEEKWLAKPGALLYCH